MDPLDKTMNHILGKTERDTQDSITTQNGAQFQSYKLFISGTFHLIFRIVGTETTESENADQGKAAIQMALIFIYSAFKS